MDHTADVASAVIFVTDLDRSVAFYADVFGCAVSLQETDAALLLTPAGFQIYLIGRGSQESHPTGGIGDRHLLWATDSRESLTQLRMRLEEKSAYTDTHTSGGITFVQGRDPDGIRVVIAYPTPAKSARSVVDSRLYN
jgi:catechol 2,3-dioxygenase-like lactoylglutathione lyase family enzyme